MSRFGALPVTILIAALLSTPSVNGQSLDEMADDLVHSDLPMFGHGADNEWPQHFYDDDSFGCTSRVAFGDWVFRKGDAEDEDDVLWYRFRNYGVFHCWANAFRASKRAELDGRPRVLERICEMRVRLAFCQRATALSIRETT